MKVNLSVEFSKHVEAPNDPLDTAADVLENVIYKLHLHAGSDEDSLHVPIRDVNGNRIGTLHCEVEEGD